MKEKDKPTWMRSVDITEVQNLTKVIERKAQRISKGIFYGSPLIDMDYGELFDAVDNLYKAANIEGLVRYNKANAEADAKKGNL